MTTYSAEYQGKKLSVSFNASIERPDRSQAIPLGVPGSSYRSITSSTWVVRGEEHLSLCQLDGFSDCAGVCEPIVMGSFCEDSKTLSIKNIENGIIVGGQHFMAKTIQSLLQQESSIEIIELDTVNNERTKEILAQYGALDIADFDLKDINASDRKPMIAALDICGFINQRTFYNGALGIRATRG
ncbi:MAG: hypothetical protein ABW078_05520 [Sedimenticola sp.]